MGPVRAVVDWSRAIRPVWAGRLALAAVREGADPRLPEAWRHAVVACRDHGWQLRGVVPIDQDIMGHHWAMVIGRSDEHEPPHLALIHGSTVSEALETGAVAIETDRIRRSQ